ncbi:MAG: hypothetical protein KC417_17755, partial [Myxococcales bacterium]|nr:hypothetical protein [Myxococcales bacterium]
QNSGLGNAVNPITSLLYIYKMPTVLLVSHRGKPGEKDEPQHERMGQITEELIKLCGIEGHYFSDDGFASSLKDVLGRGVPAGWVFPKDCLTGGPKAPPVELHVETSTAATPPRAKYSPEVSREEALRLLLPVLNGKDAPAVVSTTGKMSRELYELDDQDHTKANRFYMVGSMGCAASFSLGIARARQGKVLCLDGDGALLMKLGTLATVGLTKQKNFHHVVLDNGAHESTGGQLTASPGMDTALIALACGYKSAATVCTPDAMLKTLEEQMASDGPTLLRVLVKSGARKDLGRPKLSPRDGYIRFRDWLAANR